MSGPKMFLGTVPPVAETTLMSAPRIEERAGVFRSASDASVPVAKKPAPIKLRQKFPETWIWSNLTSE